MRLESTLDLSSLTPEEQNVVALLRDGYQDWQIALKTSSSKRDVTEVLQRIFQKLRIADQLDLAMRAFDRRS